MKKTSLNSPDATAAVREGMSALRAYTDYTAEQLSELLDAAHPNFKPYANEEKQVRGNYP